MAALADLSRVNTCNDGTGVVKLYFGAYAEIASETLDATSRKVTAITMNEGKQGFIFNLDEEESSVVTTGIGANTARNQTVITATLLNIANRELVEAYLRKACLFCIATFANGQSFVYGFDCDTQNANAVPERRNKKNGTFTINSGMIDDSGATAVPKVSVIFNYTQNYLPLELDTTFNFETFTTPAE